MPSESLVSQFKKLKTPFYYYDIDLLEQTLFSIKSCIADSNYLVHYSLKANSNERILSLIAKQGFSADCVSGNEILKAIACGFDPNQIVYAGVGKTDAEIELALEKGIMCFNCESLEEIDVIDLLAAKHRKIATIALRINPNIDARTHPHITTGLNTSKFGLSNADVELFIQKRKAYKHIQIKGIHVHIGSQITSFEAFQELALFVNDRISWFEANGLRLEYINVGGGLGVNYRDRNETMADFEGYFKVFKENLNTKANQKVIFELGRSIVAHCGSLITTVLYTKRNEISNIAIVDAGMTDLIRPAMYQSFHRIENLVSTGEAAHYFVAGPVCESTDYFSKSVLLPKTSRGDILAIYATGAYGQTMSSNYNMRDNAKAYYSDELFEI